MTYNNKCNKLPNSKQQFFKVMITPALRSELFKFKNGNNFCKLSPFINHLQKN